jgi:hypothetical protein
VHAGGLMLFETWSARLRPASYIAQVSKTGSAAPTSQEIARPGPLGCHGVLWRKIGKSRAAANEDGHYCFAIPMMPQARDAPQSAKLRHPATFMENFGPRPLPYPGFLVLPAERVPSGFQEVSHHYTKQEYGIRFRKMLNGDPIDLEIKESPTTRFVYYQSKLVREFDHQEVIGRVYAAYNKRSRKTTLNLIWLNPPKQRISIYLTQSVGNDYSPEDLIRVLESMKLAK